MCGIVGYVGNKEAAPILLEGLARLEYRGYDSAGIAVYNNKNEIETYKTKGKIQVLVDLIDHGKNVKGSMGIGHTRWATHGEPSDVNSHPQVSKSNKFAIVHNGIIENYIKLKAMLMEKDFEFVSETDTEVVADLFEYYYEDDILKTVVKVVEKLEGSYALGIICRENPDMLIAVRKESPLIIGLGMNENFIASDVTAVLQYTRKIYRLDDKEIAVLTKDSVTVYNTDLEKVKKEISEVNWDISSAEKGGYEYFMLKEIMEQPEAIKSTISPRIKNGEIIFENLSLTDDFIKGISKIFIIGCGSAYHVGVLGKYMIEKTVRIPVETSLASEFRYCDPLVNKSVLAIVISQSGETADTLAALKEARSRGAKILSIVNVVGSSIANESEDVIYTWAGPEIAVATTKAYSTQLSVVNMFALYMAKIRGSISKEEYRGYLDELLKTPDKVRNILQKREQLQYLASLFYNCHSIFFIGRNMDYAVALEGSLKLKEISYILSEAYAAGELKHGTISLIEEGTLVVAITTNDKLNDKMMSNIKQVKARGAVVIALAKETNKEIENEADYVFYVPSASDLMIPALNVIPLQIFAYYVALLKGLDIDKPRNLAKSVTVE